MVNSQCPGPARPALTEADLNGSTSGLRPSCFPRHEQTRPFLCVLWSLPDSRVLWVVQQDTIGCFSPVLVWRCFHQTRAVLHSRSHWVSEFILLIDTLVPSACVCTQCYSIRVTVELWQPKGMSSFNTCSPGQSQLQHMKSACWNMRLSSCQANAKGLTRVMPALSFVSAQHRGRCNSIIFACLLSYWTNLLKFLAMNGHEWIPLDLVVIFKDALKSFL